MGTLAYLILVIILIIITVFIMKAILKKKYKKDPEMKKKATSTGHILGIWIGSALILGIFSGISMLIFGPPPYSIATTTPTTTLPVTTGS